MKTSINAVRWFLLCLLAGLVAACGGGGDKGDSPFGGGAGGGTGGTGGGTSVGSLNLSISSTTVSATAPGTVTATLRNGSGSPVSGAVVTFTSPGGLGSFSAATALTNSNGEATVQVTPASATANGADLVVGSAATTGSSGTAASITGSVGFQVAGTAGGGQPSITVSLSSTAVTSTAPATLTAVVRNASGQPIPGQVVTFRTAGMGVGAFSVGSGLTDATGTVTTRVTPASASANGADTAIAQTTVAGTLATGSVGFSVTPVGAPPTVTPSISLALSTSSITTATPATVTATVRDGTGAGVVGQVVRFRTNDGLGTLSVTSALTDANGMASTTLSATSATSSGADQVIAATTINGTNVQATQGFQLTAGSVTIASVVADATNLGPYAQSNVTVTLANTVAGTPVTVTATSACVASGKATVTPATATTSNGVANFTYRDNGCGATASGAASATDTFRVSLTGSASTGSVAFTIASPVVNSINFVSATPTTIFLKGSGFVESSTVTFRVLDTAGNGLPNRSVLLEPTTLAGGLTLNGVNGNSTRESDSNGAVTVLVNSGTVPTPVRIKASLCTRPSATGDCTVATINSPAITTVSSSLSIAVGLPSELNFSLSQGTRNIEGYNIDGTANTYNIIASDRLGNPVPQGTAVNFVAEGGQVEASKFTTIDSSGNARATANFLSSSPRPLDGRITIVAYAIGEESFLDQNGDNIFTASEPFQDLGSVYLDRYYNGVYNSVTDQFISLALPGAPAPADCAAVGNPLLNLDVSIPSIPRSPPPYNRADSSCDGVWGRAYVRRAIETVLSTSEARPVWAAQPATSSIGACKNLIIGYGNGDPTAAGGSPGSEIVARFEQVGGTTLYNAAGAHSFLVADANPVRLNPMPAGTGITVAATQGVTATFLGGQPVASTSEATFATFSVAFTAPTTSGTVTLTFTSPRGLATSVNVGVVSGAGASSAPGSCS